MFRPITGSMDERRELMNNSMSKDIALEALEKCETLEDYLSFAKKVKNGIIAKMELYVLDNFDKVPLDVWNEYSFTMTPHTGQERLYFGKTESSKEFKNETLNKIFRERWEKSHKIESINFVLDEHDGDFSVDFNGGTWTFLWDDEVHDYYHVIKKYLKNE